MTGWNSIPGTLLQTIGPRGFLRFNLVLGGTSVVAVLNLVFWLITVLCSPSYWEKTYHGLADSPAHGAEQAAAT